MTEVEIITIGDDEETPSDDEIILESDWWRRIQSGLRSDVRRQIPLPGEDEVVVLSPASPASAPPKKVFFYLI